MTTGAIYYFNIFAFNRKAITPDFPKAHARYTFHRDKVVAAGGINAPSDYWGAQKWLDASYKAATRKNARVWSRFILNLPYDLTHDQRVQLVKEYLADVSRGRAQVAWAIHGDTKAPHAHAIFVDRDVDTGELVARLSDAGSAYRLRKMWEDACNRALAWAGSVNRVSRWGKESEHHKELNARARLESSHRHELAQTALSPMPPVATERTLDPTPEPPKVEPEPTEAPVVLKSKLQPYEEPVDAVIKQDVETPTIAAVVAFVTSQVKELDRLRAAKQAIADYRAAYSALTAQLAKANAKLQAMQGAISVASAQALKADLEHQRYTTLASRFWQVFRPTLRERAKAAKTQSSVATYNLMTKRVQAETLSRELTAINHEQKALTDKANALKSSLAVYGTDEDLSDAEALLKRTISLNAAELTAHELSTALIQGHITPDEHRTMMRVLDKGEDISY